MLIWCAYKAQCASRAQTQSTSSTESIKLYCDESNKDDTDRFDDSWLKANENKRDGTKSTLHWVSFKCSTVSEVYYHKEVPSIFQKKNDLIMFRGTSLCIPKCWIQSFGAVWGPNSILLPIINSVRCWTLNSRHGSFIIIILRPYFAISYWCHSKAIVNCDSIDIRQHWIIIIFLHGFICLFWRCLEYIAGVCVL